MTPLERRQQNAARARAWRQANPERHRENARRWQQENPERHREIQRRARKRHAEKMGRGHDYARMIRAKYGLTVEQVNVMREEQAGACAICRNTFTKTPHIDHCHETGRVRGLLCYRCNVGIGYLRSSPALLARAMEYLGAHQEATA
jgi:hypothetical protein